jgi:DNA-binding FadR family transcriptional regulator
VARRIESDIIDAGWPVGELFGSETELRLRYRVSRAVLREAVRIVEHHQVAGMRRGPTGGLIVRAPDVTPSARALVIYLAHVGTTIPDLVAARLQLETLAAAMAARSITEDGAARLRGVCAHEAGRPGVSEQDALHVVLGELSGNPAVALFVSVLAMLTRHYTVHGRPGPDEGSTAESESARAHRAIVDAVLAGDAALAERRVGKHLRALGEWFGPESRPLGSLRPPGPGPIDPDSINPIGPDPRGVKLAEVVADRIRADIARAGLGEGAVAGSEPELLARYRISRAVLREAIRLLEYHSVAGMRRGPGGGLVVLRPDPGASIESIALYLEYQRIDFDALREIRDAVELGCIERVVARRTDPRVAERLAAAQLVGPDTPVERLEELSHRFHTELAELSGNPVLALFQRILTTLAARHLRATASRGDTPPARTMAAEVARVHAGIVAAVLAGDLGLARHRMRRHLTTLSTDWWH